MIMLPMDVEPDTGGFIAIQFWDLNGIFEIESGGRWHTQVDLSSLGDEEGGQVCQTRCIEHNLLASFPSILFMQVQLLCMRVYVTMHIVHMAVYWSWHIIFMKVRLLPCAESGWSETCWPTLFLTPALILCIVRTLLTTLNTLQCKNTSDHTTYLGY